MEPLPAITPQIPAAPGAARGTARTDGAADAGAASAPDGAQDGDFQELLVRNLAGLARSAKEAGEKPGTALEKDGDAEADTARDDHRDSTLTAPDSTLALLAALPQT